MVAERRDPPGRTAGFTLIEMIVAGAVLVIVLGIVAIFFGNQTRMTRRTQARTDTQDQARLVMQLVTQDLSLTGAMNYILATGGIDSSASLTTCPTVSGVASCLQVVNTASHSQRDGISLMYVNSLRPAAQACRTVAYGFIGTTLYRHDASFTCSDTTQALVDPTTVTTSSFGQVAGDVLALDVALTCSSDATSAFDHYPDETNCSHTSAYPRSATVTVVTESTVAGVASGGQTFGTATGGTVTCPTDHFCYAMTQRVLLPNLKQN